MFRRDLNDFEGLKLYEEKIEATAYCFCILFNFSLKFEVFILIDKLYFKIIFALFSIGRFFDVYDRSFCWKAETF